MCKGYVFVYFRVVFTFPETDLAKYKDIRIVSVAVAGGFIEEDVLLRIASEHKKGKNYVKFEDHGTVEEISLSIIKATCANEDGIITIPSKGRPINNSSNIVTYSTAAYPI